MRSCALAIALLTACATGGATSGGLRRLDSESAFAEVRIRVRALAPPLSGELELLADRLARAVGDDPRLRAETLRIKIDGIPMMQAALFRPDPVVALVDAWAFLAQLEDRVLVLAPSSEAGRVALGEMRARLVEMEARFQAIWDELEVGPARAKVHEWASRHPIERLATRASPVELFAGLEPSSWRLGEIAATLHEETRDLAARIDLQTQWLPKAARWQAELLLLEVRMDPALNPVPPEFLATSVQVSELARRFPGLIEAERELALAGLRTERLAFEQYATGEREVLLLALERERGRAFADAQVVLNRTVDRAFDRVDALVLRLAMAVLLVAVALALFLLVLRRHAPRGPLPGRRAVVRS